MIVITKSLLPNVLVQGSESGIDSHDICTYICTYVGVMLGMLIYAVGFQHVCSSMRVSGMHVSSWLLELIFATRMAQDFQP